LEKRVRVSLLLAWIRHFAASLGWPGMLGLALLICAGAGGLATWQMAVENEAFRLEAANLRKQLATLPVALPEVETRRLNAVPGGGELVPSVAVVHASARRHQVTLDQGEYAWQKEAGGPGGRYRMLFPARGTYPQLRGWAADVLARRPELVLEEFSFRRDNIGDGQAEARIRFSARVEERRS
jgi:hypothetical protein